MMNKMRVAVAVAGMAVMGAGVLPAQTLMDRRVSPDCDLTITSPMFSVCGGAFSGNDAGNADVEAQTIAWLNAPASPDNPSSGGGLEDAALGEKVDEGNTGTYFKVVPDGTSGTIEFFNPISGSFALSLKAGSNFSIFVFNLLAPTSTISYSTAGVGGAGSEGTSPAGLSHATLWTGGGDSNPFCVGPTCVEVPEPTSFALYGMGLFGLGVMARRRRRQV